MSYDYSMGYCAEYAISLFRYLKHLNKDVKLAVLLGERGDEYSDGKVNVNIHSYVRAIETEYREVVYLDVDLCWYSLDEVNKLGEEWEALGHKWSRFWSLEHFDTEEELRAEFDKQGLPINEKAFLSIEQMQREIEEDYLLI